MRILLCSALCATLVACSGGEKPSETPPEAELSAGQAFLEDVLDVEPYLPADLEELGLDCAIPALPDSPLYKTSAEVDYGSPGWESRIAADWDALPGAADQAWLTIIDYRREPDGLAYRYLANDDTQDRLYEPWSSSKIMAFTAALSVLRTEGIGSDSRVGGVALADLITGINLYAPFGDASGNSNAIATYFLNLATRDYATALFHDEWLKLANDAVRFRGAYGTEVFDPQPNEFVSADGERRFAPDMIAAAPDDPGYLTYRCDTCGTDGNKAMTTLAEAEWLKRLAVHDRDTATRLPNLETEDVETTFFGRHHTDERPVGGMMLGISQFLPNAIASALDAEGETKSVLDNATDGRWRVYQKIGWGPSETRGTSEVVMLAHVCLPEIGREFTLAGRAAVPGADPNEHGVGDAGRQLSALLEASMAMILGETGRQRSDRITRTGD